MKVKKISLSICVVFVLSVFACSHILADSVFKKELFFGPVITGLEGTGLIPLKTENRTATLKRTAPVSGQTKTIHFTLDISQTSLKTVKGKDYVKVEDLKPYGNPGQPQLPFKSFIITLPKNSEVSGVTVSNVSYRPILNKLDIVRNPIPVVGSAMMNGNTNKDVKQTKNIAGKKIINEGQNIEKQTVNINQSYSTCKNCNSETFFPGDLISYYTGRNNSSRLVFIKFFPMQYISDTQKAILVTNADITIDYQLADMVPSGENK